MKGQILSELIKPDTRNSAFHITPQRLYKRLEEIRLNDNVPEEISGQIKICKKLCLYSYLVYEFATVGAQLSYFALETALKERLRRFYADGFDFKNLKTNIIKKEKPHSLASFESLLKDDKLRFMGVENFFKKGVTMHELINWAISKGILRERFKGEGGIIRRLRNFYAHPTGQKVFLPYGAINHLKMNIELINSLFI
ncbi:MAG: hypothetical protein AMJ78_00630 [Omnitrophica WOR_2 bacterium SM23_29]|nr:MAG: hypothetical protein AMJ78_00630 [Omnitrophica WOR_2 bacterium SM23_29]